MLTTKTQTININNQQLTLETGKIARQATASVVAKMKDCVILTTVVASTKTQTEKNFLPLMVNYIEKFYAAGKIPGGFNKREGKPSEKEVLTSRVIDRSIRPLFPAGFTNDVQVLCTLLSYDATVDVDMVCLISVSAALGISGLPVSDLICGIRATYNGDELVINPDVNTVENSKLDLFVSSTKTSVLMVESEAKEVTEEQMLAAIDAIQKENASVISQIEKFVEQNKKQEITFTPFDVSELYSKLKSIYQEQVSKIYQIKTKAERFSAMQSLREQILAEFVNEETSALKVADALSKLEEFVVRQRIVNEGIRIDGRDTKTIRQLDCEVSVLPKIVHGSALFTRGETQALGTVTLGTTTDEQMVDGMEALKKEHFMLHYNFPAYCVGEIDPLRGPGRREIGHGKLAYKALRPVMPTKDEFPYTVRIVSEVTESHGSSSMATVCTSVLALLDAGVPIKKSVAGIAMGLIKEGEKFSILTDIMGDEDFLGDMDFKVAGTQSGITALQMDMKINGIDFDALKQALSQAKDARLFILNAMNSTQSSPSTDLSPTVPKILETKINPAKIADLIGKAGATIKSICEQSGCKLDVDNDGNVKVFAPNQEAGEHALSLVADAVMEIKIGEIYPATVAKVMSFGLLMDLPGKKSGMVHISEIANIRIEDITQHAKEGEKFNVKVLGFDEKRRLKLSIKKAMDGANTAQSQKSTDSSDSSRDVITDSPYNSHLEADIEIPSSFSDFVGKINN